MYKEVKLQAVQYFEKQLYLYKNCFKNWIISNTRMIIIISPVLVSKKYHLFEIENSQLMIFIIKLKIAYPFQDRGMPFQKL